MYSEKLSQRWVTTSHGVTKRGELDVVRFGRYYFVEAAGSCALTRNTATQKASSQEWKNVLPSAKIFPRILSEVGVLETQAPAEAAGMQGIDPSDSSRVRNGREDAQAHREDRPEVCTAL